MKRMICLILLASLMALSVAGCGKEKDTGVVSIRLIEESQKTGIDMLQRNGIALFRGKKT